MAYWRVRMGGFHKLPLENALIVAVESRIITTSVLGGEELVVHPGAILEAVKSKLFTSCDFYGLVGHLCLIKSAPVVSSEEIFNLCIVAGGHFFSRFHAMEI